MINDPHLLYNPYSSLSQPIQFVFRVNSPLQATEYTFLNSNKVRSSPNVDIDPSFLYLFYSFSFSADIDQLDYQSAIKIDDISATGNFTDQDTVPVFSMYLEGESSGQILRQPLAIPQYYADIDYRQWRKPRNASGTGSSSLNSITQLTGSQVNTLKGSFEAVLTQIPNLIGKESINMVMTFFAQEITDDEQKETLLGKKKGRV